MIDKVSLLLQMNTYSDDNSFPYWGEPPLPIFIAYNTHRRELAVILVVSETLSDILSKVVAGQYNFRFRFVV